MADVAALQAIEADFQKGQREYCLVMRGAPVSSSEMPDSDFAANILAEGAFIRCFTLWESAVERAFIYFCEGGAALNGVQPICRLANCGPSEIRSILTNGMRFLDWSSPRIIRERAALYFEHGLPFEISVGGKSAVLSDMQKLRNRIAHNSVESLNGYLEVQRNNFNTERTFDFPPGQMLRTVARKTKKNWGEYYFEELEVAFNSVLRP
jgi:hypothetical protein